MAFSGALMTDRPRAAPFTGLCTLRCKQRPTLGVQWGFRILTCCPQAQGAKCSTGGTQGRAGQPLGAALHKWEAMGRFLLESDLRTPKSCSSASAVLLEVPGCPCCSSVCSISPICLPVRFPKLQACFGRLISSHEILRCLAI